MSFSIDLVSIDQDFVRLCSFGQLLVLRTDACAFASAENFPRAGSRLVERKDCADLGHLINVQPWVLRAQLERWLRRRPMSQYWLITNGYEAMNCFNRTGTGTRIEVFGNNFVRAKILNSIARQAIHGLELGRPDRIG